MSETRVDYSFFYNAVDARIRAQSEARFRSGDHDPLLGGETHPTPLDLTRAALQMAIDGDPSRFLSSAAYYKEAIYAVTYTSYGYAPNASEALKALVNARQAYTARRPFGSSGLVTGASSPGLDTPETEDLLLHLSLWDGASIGALKEELVELEDALRGLSTDPSRREIRTMLGDYPTLRRAVMAAARDDRSADQLVRNLVTIRNLSLTKRFAELPPIELNIDYRLLRITVSDLLEDTSFSDNFDSNRLSLFEDAKTFLEHLPFSYDVRVEGLRRHAEALLEAFQLQWYNLPQPPYVQEAIKALQGLISGRLIRLIPVDRPVDERALRAWRAREEAKGLEDVDRSFEELAGRGRAPAQGARPAVGGYVETVGPPSGSERSPLLLTPTEMELRVTAREFDPSSGRGAKRFTAAVVGALREILQRRLSEAEVAEIMGNPRSPHRAEIRRVTQLEETQFAEAVTKAFEAIRGAAERGRERPEDKDGREGKPGRGGKGPVRGK